MFKEGDGSPFPCEQSEMKMDMNSMRKRMILLHHQAAPNTKIIRPKYVRNLPRLSQVAPSLAGGDQNDHETYSTGFCPPLGVLGLKGPGELEAGFLQVLQVVLAKKQTKRKRRQRRKRRSRKERRRYDRASLTFEFKHAANRGNRVTHVV